MALHDEILQGYAEFPERPGLEGLRDKLTVMSTVAWKHALDDEPFRDHVLTIVRHAGNAADAQFRMWEQHCKDLPYRREPGEIIRSPDRVALTGGDCDCLAIYEAAGLRALGIPVLMQVLTDEEGNGYHIRNLVGFPPQDPQAWVISDPVVDSEAQWAMVDRTGINPSLDGKSSTLISLTESETQPAPNVLVWLAIGAGVTLLAQRFLR